MDTTLASRPNVIQRVRRELRTGNKTIATLMKRTGHSGKTIRAALRSLSAKKITPPGGVDALWELGPGR
jgi:hypothetical protein